jgi:hypothetical protein
MVKRKSILEEIERMLILKLFPTQDLVTGFGVETSILVYTHTIMIGEAIAGEMIPLALRKLQEVDVRNRGIVMVAGAHSG